MYTPVYGLPVSVGGIETEVRLAEDPAACAAEELAVFAAAAFAAGSRDIDLFGGD